MPKCPNANEIHHVGKYLVAVPYPVKLGTETIDGARILTADK